MIEIENVTKTYDNKIRAVDNVSLRILEAEFVSLIGPSGCGKTSLLKMINALIDFDSGDIRVKNKSIKDWNKIELRRNIGYVIQQIGLFPHMTIEDNISYVLSLKKTSKEEKKERAKELIKLVGLDEDLLTRYPAELSGGQNQRVGVARALAANPDIILMDEPFGAVDEITRKKLQDELLALQQKLKKTIVFVTHDIEEALKLGNKIVLMRAGKIEQVANKEDLIFNPATDFVKDFIGLKGFKTTLDEKKLEKIYEETKREILNKTK